MNVCTRCEATMDRRTAIPEGAGRRYWGDVEPFVYVGDAEIHHFICTNCGNLTAIRGTHVISEALDATPCRR